MIDNHAHTLAAEKAEHAHLVAGAEVGELRQIERVVGYIYHPELLRVVEKADIDSTPVGRVMVHNLKVAVSNVLGLYKILKHRDVLYLTHAYDGRAVRRAPGLELRYGVRQVVDLGPILVSVPFVLSLRGKLKVVFAVVVDRVEKVLQIVESHPEHFTAPLGL